MCLVRKARDREVYLGLSIFLFKLVAKGEGILENSNIGGIALTSQNFESNYLFECGCVNIEIDTILPVLDNVKD